ncbi:MAG: hypothetical protein AB1638_04640 [Nitrospirota bacterium]
MRRQVTFYFLLFTVCLFISCGKRGDPSLKSYEKPDPPSGLRAIHRGSEIILLWNFSKEKEPSIKGFYLMKAIVSSPSLEKGIRKDFEKIAFLKSDERSYADTDFNIGTEYRYKIVSQNLRGILSNDSDIINIIPRKVPFPPRKVEFRVEDNSLLLSWERAGDGILYNVYRTYKKGQYTLMPLNREPIRETSFKDNFEIEKTVYYAIRSLLGGDVRDEGPLSEEVEVNPSEFVPSPPEGLQAVVTEDKTYLLWKEAAETWVTGYRIYREIDKKEGFVFIGDTQIPAFVDNERPTVSRNYRVTAIGPSKESPATEIGDVVFIPYR